METTYAAAFLMGRRRSDDIAKWLGKQAPKLAKPFVGESAPHAAAQGMLRVSVAAVPLTLAHT